MQSGSQVKRSRVESPAAASGTSCCQEVLAGGDAMELGCTARQRRPGLGLPDFSGCWGDFLLEGGHLPADGCRGLRSNHKKAGDTGSCTEFVTSYACLRALIILVKY